MFCLIRTISMATVGTSESKIRRNAFASDAVGIDDVKGESLFRGFGHRYGVGNTTGDVIGVKVYVFDFKIAFERLQPVFSRSQRAVLAPVAPRGRATV